MNDQLTKDVTRLREDAERTAEDLTDEARSRGKGVADRGKQAAKSAYRDAKEAARQAGERAPGKAREGTDWLMAKARAYPVAAAAIAGTAGLLLGRVFRRR